jgi:hypothetical protein
VRDIRALLFIWVFGPMLHQIIRAWNSLDHGVHRYPARVLESRFLIVPRLLPSHIPRIVSLLHPAISHAMSRDSEADLFVAVVFLLTLKEWWPNCSDALLPSSAFWNEEFTETLSLSDAAFL